MAIEHIVFGEQEIAAITLQQRHGLVQPTVGIATRLGHPGRFTLEGDMREVAQVLAPSIAPSLTDEQLPHVDGVRHGATCTVAARLPGLLPDGGPAVVADVTYSITPPKRGARITAAAITLFGVDPAEHPAVTADMALPCIISGIGELLLGNFSDAVYWRTE